MTAPDWQPFDSVFKIVFLSLVLLVAVIAAALLPPIIAGIRSFREKKPVFRPIRTHPIIARICDEEVDHDTIRALDSIVNVPENRLTERMRIRRKRAQLAHAIYCIQSRRHKSVKSEPFDTMVVEKPEDTPEVEADIVEDGEESNRAVYKRQQTEWRKMKNQVAQLKKQRKALTKKQREKKREISKEIKLLISSMRSKHEQELKDLGIVAPARHDDDEDLMMDEDE